MQGGIGAGVCSIQSVTTCAAICASVSDCAFFTISTTQACYACFVHKTCPSPSTSYMAGYGSDYDVYQLSSGSVAATTIPSGDWYLGDADQSCDDACASHGLSCTAEELAAHNADVDTCEEVIAIVRGAGGPAIDASQCKTDDLTASSSPMF